MDEVGFTRLGGAVGAGGADELTDLVGSLSGYTRRVVVILDREAKAYEHVRALLGSGGLSAEDVLLFSNSLEEANATDVELADLAVSLAADASVAVSLTGTQLQAFHESRVTPFMRARVKSPGWRPRCSSWLPRRPPANGICANRRWMSVSRC